MVVANAFAGTRCAPPTIGAATDALRAALMAWPCLVYATVHPHGKDRYRCEDCEGASICIHNKVRGMCRDCGSSICPHGIVRGVCRAVTAVGGASA